MKSSQDAGRGDLRILLFVPIPFCCWGSPPPNTPLKKKIKKRKAQTGSSHFVEHASAARVCTAPEAQNFLPEPGPGGRRGPEGAGGAPSGAGTASPTPQPGSPEPRAGPAGVKARGRQKGGRRGSFPGLSVENRTAALWTLPPARKGILLQVMTSCGETRRTQ